MAQLDLSELTETISEVEVILTCTLMLTVDALKVRVITVGVIMISLKAVMPLTSIRSISSPVHGCTVKPMEPKKLANVPLALHLTKTQFSPSTVHWWRKSRFTF